MTNWIDNHRLHALAAIGTEARARHATVSAVDPINHAVRVVLQPEGVAGGWIPDPGLACASLRIACPCEVGTQVLVVPVEGDAEHPLIVARIFDAVTTPPVSPATGKPVQPGEIGIFLQGGAYLHLSGGNVSIGGAVHVAGSIVATGDVVAGSVSLDAHVHGGVQSGQGFTGAPRT